MSNDRADADIDVLAMTMNCPTRLAGGILSSGAVHLESPTTVRDRWDEATAVLEEFR